MTEAQRQQYLEAIIGRMRAEEAVDVSDAEIERCLRPCVSGKKLVPLAMELRRAGLLTTEALT